MKSTGSLTKLCFGSSVRMPLLAAVLVSYVLCGCGNRSEQNARQRPSAPLDDRADTPMIAGPTSIGQPSEPEKARAVDQPGAEAAGHPQAAAAVEKREVPLPPLEDDNHNQEGPKPGALGSARELAAPEADEVRSPGPTTTTDLEPHEKRQKEYRSLGKIIDGKLYMRWVKYVPEQRTKTVLKDGLMTELPYQVWKPVWFMGVFDLDEELPDREYVPY